MKIDLTFDGLQAVYKRKGYSFFTNDAKNLNLNYGAFRNPDSEADRFDDLFFLSWIYRGNKNLVTWTGTTDPSEYWLKKLGNPKGTAILKEGQYLKGFKLGKHKGQYEALVQNTEVTVHRDRNRDGKHDFDGKLDTGFFGINHHRARETGITTDPKYWSAGCQVAEDSKQHEYNMMLIKEACRIYEDDRISYTLFNMRDYNEPIPG